MAAAKPLPLPIPPKRSLSPQAQRIVSGSGSYRLDDPTPVKNENLAEFQGLLSIFDEMSHGERFEFIELARLFAELTPHDRRVAIIALRKLAGREFSVAIADRLRRYRDWPTDANRATWSTELIGPKSAGSVNVSSSGLARRPNGGF